MLLDVNETMGAHLADAKLALKSQVTSKILFNKQDVLGIGLVGTEGTDNMVADEMGDGQYEHVSVVKKVAKATFSSLEALDAAACSGASGDLIDGVVVAVDAITKFVRNLKFGKRLVLVTDGHAFMGIEDDDVDQIAEGMVREAIRFTVLGVGLASLSAEVKPEVKPEGGEGVGASAREQFVRCLGRFRAKLGERFEFGGHVIGTPVTSCERRMLRYGMCGERTRDVSRSTKSAMCARRSSAFDFSFLRPGFPPVLLLLSAGCVSAL